MKKYAKIIVSILLLTCLVGVFAGCSGKQLSNDTIMEAISNAVSESIKRQDNYYARERTKLTEEISTEFTFNVKKDIAGTELDERQVELAIMRTKVSDYRRDWHTFSYSLPSSIKPKKATLADYKYYHFGGRWKASSATGQTSTKEMQEFKPADVFNFTDVVFDGYVKDANGNFVWTKDGCTVELNYFVIQNLLGNLSSLTQSDLDFSANYKQGTTNYKGGAVKKGKVFFYRFKVTKSDNAYFNYPLMEVRVLNGKILRVASLDEKYVADFTYDGPKIAAANYDKYL